MVSDLLCSSAARRHVGTTDIDIQVDLEIQSGSVNASRLEQALRAAGFIPDSEREWCWREESAPGAVVKVEFLADLDIVPNHQAVSFDDCEHLGAQNLRGQTSLMPRHREAPRMHRRWQGCIPSSTRRSLPTMPWRPLSPS